jgi:hypothetical protein
MSAPYLRINGLSVSRAYISPEKPRLEASFLFLLGFLLVSWKGEDFRFATVTTYGVLSDNTYN